MRLFEDYQCFLFDFDGLLVNTEHVHFQAYKNVCEKRGFDLDWDFTAYCRAAHYHQDGLKDKIYEKFPDLYASEPSWDVIYAEKKKMMADLLNGGGVQLMPGVEDLLQALEKTNVKRCVVTHSSDELVSIVRQQNPVLNTIPHWFTREHYTHPKPHPECYQKAIEMLADFDDRVIGFEDTPRGLKALMQTRAQAVIVTEVPYPELEEFKQKGALHFSSFEKVRSVGIR